MIKGKIAMKYVKVGKYEIELTNQQVIFFPKKGYTKGNLVSYYKQIAPYLYVFVKDRPITMVRYPNGIESEGFFQKNAPKYFPAWIKTVAVAKKGNGSTTYIVINSEATIVYLANQACIAPHMWLSRQDKLDHPDMIVFDIDPPDEISFNRVCKGALALKDELKKIAIPSFVKTSGSKGLHVLIPIKRNVSFDQTRGFATYIAQKVIEKHSNDFTLEFRKEKRGGRILLDIFRNAYAQTVVAPYAVRPKPMAPVSMPVSWKEVASGQLTAQKYTISNVPQLLKEQGDLWEDMFKQAVSIKALVNKFVD